MPDKKLSLTDELAIDRTRLANERTFLAYFRSFLVIMSSGLAIIKLQILEEIQNLGYFFLALSPFLLFIGITRFFYVKARIKRYREEKE